MANDCRAPVSAAPVKLRHANFAGPKSQQPDNEETCSWNSRCKCRGQVYCRLYTIPVRPPENAARAAIPDYCRIAAGWNWPRDPVNLLHKVFTVVLDAILQSERLVLKPLSQSDARGLLDYVNVNREWLAPWEPVHPASYFTTEGQRNILRQCEGERRAETGILFGIYEQGGNPSEILGRISISGIMRGIWQNGFLGYSIAGSRAKRGYITEALLRVVRYGFVDLGLHRLQASIIPRNTASVRVVQKCNFRNEGRAKRYLKINDIWEDHDMYALTFEEFGKGTCR